MFSEERIRQITSQFALSGPAVSTKPFGHGHIHDSYLVTAASDGQVPRRYLLQRLNDAVFADPARLMDNIRRVTTHVRAKLMALGVLDCDRRVLELVPASCGNLIHRDPNGQYWRLYRFIEGTRVYDTVRTPKQAEGAGHAFGLFQQLLMDIPPPRLYEVIPGFHDTPRRVAALEQAVGADVCGRVPEVKAELAHIFENRALARALVDRLREGELPERIAHNDAKISNVLFDERTNEALCVTDLDTVMPGTSLYDFGDMVRSMCTMAKEDEPDVTKVTLDRELFVALARGYLRSAGSFLTMSERRHLILAGQVFTLEQGVRFLTDYLQGDRYYRTTRPRQNLDRCRAQLRLMECLMRAAPELQTAIALPSEA